MSTESIASRRSRRSAGGPPRRVWIGPLILAVAFVALLIGLDQRLRGPVATTSRLEHLRSPQQAAMAERAFLNAQLALAHADSLNIVLDARENRLWIVMKGVKIHECRLPRVAFDEAILGLARDGSEALWLERPFTLKARQGRLPDPWKPIVEGKLDTVSVGGVVAARELPMDGSLLFDRDLVLHISTPPTRADSLEMKGVKGLLRRFDRRRDEAAAAWREMFDGPTTLDIYMQISREDAASVLRALPVGGGMALRI